MVDFFRIVKRTAIAARAGARRRFASAPVICEKMWTGRKKRTPNRSSEFFVWPLDTSVWVECNAPGNQPYTNKVAQMFENVKPCAEIFYRASQGCCAPAGLGLDKPGTMKARGLDRYRTGRRGAHATRGVRSPLAQPYAPREPPEGAAGAGGRQGGSPQQRSGKPRAKKPRGARRKKGGQRPPTPPGVEQPGPTPRRGRPKGGTGDRRKEHNRAGATPGRPQEPAAQRRQGKWTAAAASGTEPHSGAHSPSG